MEFAPFYDVIGWAKSEYGFDIELETCGFSHTVPSAFWNTDLAKSSKKYASCFSSGLTFLKKHDGISPCCKFLAIHGEHPLS